ncbi:hypothetical protein NMG60_11005144 [Bertholletia excelsa]
MGIGEAEVAMHCIIDGSISMFDMDIERRPYHRYCSCALHKSKVFCSNCCHQIRNISFPQKKPWRKHSLKITVSHTSSPSSFLQFNREVLQVSNKEKVRS